MQLRWRIREQDVLGSTVMALMDTGAHFGVFHGRTSELGELCPSDVCKTSEVCVLIFPV